jgi:predicted AAA+ superfamily ATPase
MKAAPGAGDQLTAFLTSLFKAIESSSHAALVYTLAIGKDGQPMDAYASENQYIADRMAEAESVSARKATLLNPTEDDETVKVLRRRLFEKVDEAKAGEIIAAYRGLWSANSDIVRLMEYVAGIPVFSYLIAWQWSELILVASKIK